MKLTDFLDALPANAGHGLGASIRGLGAFGGFDSHRRPSRKSQWAMHMHSVTQAHGHAHISCWDLVSYEPFVTPALFRFDWFKVSSICVEDYMVELLGLADQQVMSSAIYSVSHTSQSLTHCFPGTLYGQGYAPSPKCFGT